MLSNRSGNQKDVQRIVLIPSRQEPATKEEPEYKYLPPIQTQLNENIDPKWVEFKIDGKNLAHRAYSSICTHGDYLYLYGGYQVSTGIMDDFYRMNLNAPHYTWERLPSKDGPGPRSRHQMCTFRDRLFMFGGQEKQSISTNAMWTYDLNLRNWTKVKINGTYPPEIDNYASVVNANNWIIFGGFFGGSVGLHSNYLYSYDFVNNVWVHYKAKTQAPAPRDGAAIALYRDSVFVFGGSDGHQRFNDMWNYNITKLSWNYVPVNSQCLPRVRSGHIMTTSKDSLIVFGGIHDITWELDDLFKFDLKSMEWFSIDEDSARRKETQVLMSPVKGSNQPSKQHFRRTVRSTSIRKTKRISSIKKMENQSVDSTESPTRNMSLAQATQKTLEEKKKKDQVMKKLAMLKLFEVDPKTVKNDSPTSAAMKNSIEMVGNPKSDLKVREGKLTEFGKPIISKFLQPLQSQSNTIAGKRPCARDGHAATVFNNQLLIFGGDRHQMSFNDIHGLDLSKI